MCAEREDACVSVRVQVCARVRISVCVQVQMCGGERKVGECAGGSVVCVWGYLGVCKWVV